MRNQTLGEGRKGEEEEGEKEKTKAEEKPERKREAKSQLSLIGLLKNLEALSDQLSVSYEIRTKSQLSARGEEQDSHPFPNASHSHSLSLSLTQSLSYTLSFSQYSPIVSVYLLQYSYY